MKFYSDHNPNTRTQLVGNDIQSAYINVAPSAPASVTHAALYVCERAKSTTDARYLLDALGLLDQLVSLE